ncbi:MAG: hypothetical protein K8R01_02470, partial [Methanococcoides sp.]|nr:hypothetical protein [Methanococcoides sp.]
MNDFNIQPDSTYFIDTNIWLYSFIQSQNKEKTEIARTIIKECEIVIRNGDEITSPSRRIDLGQI